jgi:hypothetical protein
VTRNATDFSILILYSAMLLNMFVRFNSFGMEILEFFRYKIISSANQNHLTSPFPIWVAFISFSCLIIWAENSRTILNKTGEIGHPWLVPDFRGNGFGFSPFRMMLVIGLLLISFIILRYVLSITSFLKKFYHKRMLNFVKGSFYIYWVDDVVSVLDSVYELYSILMHLYLALEVE